MQTSKFVPEMGDHIWMLISKIQTCLASREFVLGFWTRGMGNTYRMYWKSGGVNLFESTRTLLFWVFPFRFSKTLFILFEIKMLSIVRRLNASSLSNVYCTVSNTSILGTLKCMKPMENFQIYRNSSSFFTRGEVL